MRVMDLGELGLEPAGTIFRARSSLRKDVKSSVDIGLYKKVNPGNSIEGVQYITIVPYIDEIPRSWLPGDSRGARFQVYDPADVAQLIVELHGDCYP